MFGAGVLWHLLRHGRRYDVVHTASFPYFSLLAAARGAAAARATGWSSTGTRCGRWRTGASTSVGAADGSAGSSSGCACGSRSGRSASRGCTRAGCARRATGRSHRARGRVRGVLGARETPLDAEPLVVFAGRHIPEKRVAALVPAIARARATAARAAGRALRRRARARARAAGLPRGGLDGAIDVPGFVDADGRRERVSRALCMVLPSRREGYGLVVVEAASHGTPSVVVADPGQRRGRADRGGRQRVRRRKRRARGPRGGDPPRSRRRRGAAPVHGGVVCREWLAAVARPLARNRCADLRAAVRVVRRGAR